MLLGTTLLRPQGWSVTRKSITTVTGQCSRKGAVKALCVAVSSHTIHHKFWVANIQDAWIIGLDLLFVGVVVGVVAVDVRRAMLYLGSEALALHTSREPVPISHPQPLRVPPSLQ